MTSKWSVTVGGMSCGHCVKTLTGELSNLPGVRDLVVEVGRATLVLPPGVGEAEIRGAVAEAGFEVLQAREEAGSARG